MLDSRFSLLPHDNMTLKPLSTNLQVPTYEAQTATSSDSFTIGGKKGAGPFFTLSQVRDHLSLLSAFGKLRSDVRSGKDFSEDGMPPGGESAPDYDNLQQQHSIKQEVTEEMKAQEELAGEF